MADPTFSLTRNQIIIDAMNIIGAAEDGNNPSANEFTLAGRRLNALLNELAPFIEVPNLTDKEHTLTAGTKSYTVGDSKDIDMYRPYNLVYARRKNSSTSDELEIDTVDRQEYMSLPNKDTQGPPNLVYYHPGTSQGTVHVWPTGDSTWDTLVLTFTTPLNTLDATSDTLDLPQEWHEPVTWLLAEAIAPIFIGQIPQWLTVKARKKRNTMMSHDTNVGSVFFQFNSRQ